MKKLFIREELRTLQQKLSNEKESENILKRAEINLAPSSGNTTVKKHLSEKSSEKCIAEKKSEKCRMEKGSEVKPNGTMGGIFGGKTSEKCRMEKPNEVKIITIDPEILQALLGIQTSSNNDRLL